MLTAALEGLLSRLAVDPSVAEEGELGQADSPGQALFVTAVVSIMSSVLRETSDDRSIRQLHVRTIAAPTV